MDHLMWFPSVSICHLQLTPLDSTENTLNSIQTEAYNSRFLIRPGKRGLGKWIWRQTTVVARIKAASSFKIRVKFVHI